MIFCLLFQESTNNRSLQLSKDSTDTENEQIMSTQPQMLALSQAHDSKMSPPRQVTFIHSTQYDDVASQRLLPDFEMSPVFESQGSEVKKDLKLREKVIDFNLDSPSVIRETIMRKETDKQNILKSSEVRQRTIQAQEEEESPMKQDTQAQNPVQKNIQEEIEQAAETLLKEKSQNANFHQSIQSTPKVHKPESQISPEQQRLAHLAQPSSVQKKKPTEAETVQSPETERLKILAKSPHAPLSSTHANLETEKLSSPESERLEILTKSPVCDLVNKDTSKSVTEEGSGDALRNLGQKIDSSDDHLFDQSGRVQGSGDCVSKQGNSNESLSQLRVRETKKEDCDEVFPQSEEGEDKKDSGSYEILPQSGIISIQPVSCSVEPENSSPVKRKYFVEASSSAMKILPSRRAKINRKYVESSIGSTENSMIESPRIEKDTDPEFDPEGESTEGDESGGKNKKSSTDDSCSPGKKGRAKKLSTDESWSPAKKGKSKKSNTEGDSFTPVKKPKARVKRLIADDSSCTSMSENEEAPKRSRRLGRVNLSRKPRESTMAQLDKTRNVIVAMTPKKEKLDAAVMFESPAKRRRITRGMKKHSLYSDATSLLQPIPTDTGKKKAPKGLKPKAKSETQVTEVVSNRNEKPKRITRQSKTEVTEDQNEEYDRLADDQLKEWKEGSPSKIVKMIEEPPPQKRTDEQSSNDSEVEVLEKTQDVVITVPRRSYSSTPRNSGSTPCSSRQSLMKEDPLSVEIDNENIENETPSKELFSNEDQTDSAHFVSVPVEEVSDNRTQDGNDEDTEPLDMEIVCKINAVAETPCSSRQSLMKEDAVSVEITNENVENEMPSKELFSNEDQTDSAHFVSVPVEEVSDNRTQDGNDEDTEPLDMEIVCKIKAAAETPCSSRQSLTKEDAVSVEIDNENIENEMPSKELFSNEDQTDSAHFVSVPVEEVSDDRIQDGNDEDTEPLDMKIVCKIKAVAETEDVVYQNSEEPKIVLYSLSQSNVGQRDNFSQSWTDVSGPSLSKPDIADQNLPRPNESPARADILVSQNTDKVQSRLAENDLTEINTDTNKPIGNETSKEEILATTPTELSFCVPAENVSLPTPQCSLPCYQDRPPRTSTDASRSSIGDYHLTSQGLFKRPVSIISPKVNTPKTQSEDQTAIISPKVNTPKTQSEDQAAIISPKAHLPQTQSKNQTSYISPKAITPRTESEDRASNINPEANLLRTPADDDVSVGSPSSIRGPKMNPPGALTDYVEEKDISEEGQEGKADEIKEDVKELVSDEVETNTKEEAKDLVCCDVENNIKEERAKELVSEVKELLSDDAKPQTRNIRERTTAHLIPKHKVIPETEDDLTEGNTGEGVSEDECRVIINDNRSNKKILESLPARRDEPDCRVIVRSENGEEQQESPERHTEEESVKTSDEEMEFNEEAIVASMKALFPGDTYALSAPSVEFRTLCSYYQQPQFAPDQ